jgi:DNA-binding Lrp family transcriptional regulator
MPFCFTGIAGSILSKVEVLPTNPKGGFYNVKFLLESQQRVAGDYPSKQLLTPKSLHLLKLLWENGSRNSVYTIHIKQGELAKKLQITRQALSAHFKRLREAGFIQIGHGFLNVTEDGLRAIGYHRDPVLVLIRLQPQKRSEVSAKMKSLPAIEIYRVTGDADVVAVVEQGVLNEVLQILSATDGVTETRSLVTIETLK